MDRASRTGRGWHLGHHSQLHARWLNIGAGDGNRTHDSLLGKPQGRQPNNLGTSIDWLEVFIASRKGERGLTAKGEAWVRVTLGRFLKRYPDPWEISRRDVESYLTPIAGQWNKHSHFRAIRTGAVMVSVSVCFKPWPCHSSNPSWWVLGVSLSFSKVNPNQCVSSTEPGMQC